MEKPGVMVSSTLYDLRQIRADLEQFVDSELGYRALLSEFPSFPVDPDKSAVENCRKRVEEDADIMILLVGGRYGSIDKRTEKSITNLEYLEARQKRIPVYVFIDKQILSILPVWKKNPESDYSGQVDTPKLFEFIESVRSAESVWTFPFEIAQDVIGTLRIQLAYLVREGLDLRRRLSGIGIPASFERLGPAALRLALEKSLAWEYLLYLQVWQDEVQRRSALFKEFEAGLRIGDSEPVSPESAPQWFGARVRELEGLIDSANQIIKVSAPEAFGEPGKAGDEEAIIWSSVKLGDIYEAAINWAQRIRRASVSEPFTNTAVEMVPFPGSLLERFQNFPKESIDVILSAIPNASKENFQDIRMTLTIELENVEAYERAASEGRRRFEAGDY
ncbi:MAG: DUF4062 domain-containing protein [Planctomycetota bacterium]|nr:DUF4062 domain-containing protein [Planctomycetota bacterium]